MKLKEIIFDIDEAPKSNSEGIKPSLDQMLIGQYIKRHKASSNEPEMFYRIEGVFLNTFTIGKPILLVYTYLKETGSYQIVEYQTSLLVQKPKGKNQNYLTLKELKEADHNAYFEKRVQSSKAYFEHHDAIITSVEIMLYFLIEQALKKYGILNQIQEDILIEMQRPFMEEKDEEEDMFSE